MATKPAFTLRGDSAVKQATLDQNLKQMSLFTSLSDFRQESIVVDLSDSTGHYDLGGLLWLLVVLHALKKQACEVSIRLPDPEDAQGERVWRFLKTWKFFEALNMCVDHPANLLSDTQSSWIARIDPYPTAKGFDENGNIQQLFTGRLLEITNFLLRSDAATSSADDIDGYVNRWKSKVIMLGVQNLCRWSEDEADAFVSRVISEGLYNSVVHAKGTFLLASMNVDAYNLILGVADNGIGIPGALRTTFSEGAKSNDLAKMTDADLIKYYTQPEMILDSQLIRISTAKGVSSDKTRAGFGLYYLKDFVLSHGGSLRIRSGAACVMFKPGEEEVEDTLVCSPGTTMRIVLPRKSQSELK
ncbi:MAG: ATP-binding protein [Bryobacteraceae bacterium]